MKNIQKTNEICYCLGGGGGGGEFPPLKALKKTLSACSHCAPNATSTWDELSLAGVDRGLLINCPLYISGLRMLLRS